MLRVAAWPLVAQLARRESFDLLAVYTERVHLDPAGAAISDRLTTLYTRALLETALDKKVYWAGRYGHPIFVILFDVDNLSAINKKHGHGVGDRVLERLRIAIRGFFRQHDWVTRYGEDSIAVLLNGPLYTVELIHGPLCS